MQSNFLVFKKCLTLAWKCMYVSYTKLLKPGDKNSSEYFRITIRLLWKLLGTAGILKIYYYRYMHSSMNDMHAYIQITM